MKITKDQLLTLLGEEGIAAMRLADGGVMDVVLCAVNATLAACEEVTAGKEKKANDAVCFLKSVAEDYCKKLEAAESSARFKHSQLENALDMLQKEQSAKLSLMDKCDKLVSDLVSAKKENVLLQKTINRYKAADYYPKYLDEQRERIHLLNRYNDLSRNCSDLERRLDSCTKNEKDLIADLATCRKSKDDMIKVNKDLADRAKSLENELLRVNKGLDIFGEDCEEVKRLKEDNRILRGEIIESRAGLEQLADQVRRKEIRIVKLREKREKAKKYLADTELFMQGRISYLAQVNRNLERSITVINAAAAEKIKCLEQQLAKCTEKQKLS